MFEMAREVIGTQPILAIFLAIGLGYLVGQINLGGFSLGVGAVLFVGLAIGAFAPKSQIVGPISLIGLIMFLYGIGILYGRQFFEGMFGAEGRKYNLLALVAVLASLLVALGLGKAFGIKVGHTLGIYAGSLTSTATLQAALDVMRNKEPSIGYSLAYPFGVIGPILCIYFMTREGAAEVSAKGAEIPYGRDHACSERGVRTVAELMRELPAGVKMTMVRKNSQNMVPCRRDHIGSWRRRDDHFRPAGGHCHRRGERREPRARSPRQGPRRSRLHPCFRRQSQCGRRAAQGPSPAGRLTPPTSCTSGGTTRISCLHPI